MLMVRKIRNYTLLVVLITLFIISCAQSNNELIPREVLFGNPVKTKPQISPDGQMMAYLAPYNDVLNVWIKTIGKNDDRAITKDDNRGIHHYAWAHDNKHLLYIQDRDGNENWRLYAVNIKTQSISELTPFEDVTVRIIERNKDYPNELLIALNKRDPKYHDAYHLNLQTGELKLVAENPGDVYWWLADADLRIRGAVLSTPGGGWKFKVRKNEESPWRTLAEWDFENSINNGPIGFTEDGDYVYLLDSRHSNSSRLTKMNLNTGEYQVIAGDSIYDVTSIMMDPDTREIQAVAFAREREEWQALDSSIKDDFAVIRNLHHGDFDIYSRDDKDITWIVGFTADDGPISFYAYNRENQQATFLFYHIPELNDYTLASMESISFTSRDGLTIYGYITFPPDKARENLPMVLRVHGGPFMRDMWGFHSEVQWLANRGYICLQVNYRGSSGYGKAFLNAGNREWGGKIHNDLVDAVNWAVDKGYADPDRVAIYGASFGGYAALVGATFTPDLFCCAIDAFGPGNLVTWIKLIPPYWTGFLANMYKRVGNPETDAEFLRSISPLFKVDRIEIPILIAQGANDVRVKCSESEQIVDELRKKGIDYEYLLFEDEGHGFVKPENKLEFYAAAEEFLAEHLGGRYQPVGEK